MVNQIWTIAGVALVVAIIASVATSTMMTGYTVKVRTGAEQDVYTKGEVDQIVLDLKSDPCAALMTIFRGSFLKTCADKEYNRAADIDNSRKVDLGDLSYISPNFGNKGWCEKQFTKTANPCQ